MKNRDSDIHDIYQSPEAAEAGQELAAETAVRMSEQFERDIRRHRLVGFVGGLLAGGLLLSVVFLAVTDYLSQAVEPEPVLAQKNIYVATHTLPHEEQWVLDYHKVAAMSYAESRSEDTPHSTKWIKNAAYHLIMGEQALEMNELEAAQAHLEEALIIFPEIQDARRALGAVYLKQKNFSKAVEVLELSLEEAPSLDVLVNLGAAYIGTGEYEQAERFLLEALAIQPDLAGCHKNLAILYKTLEKNDAAVLHFEAYLAASPADEEMVQIYTDYLIGLGRTKEALVLLENAQTENPTHVLLLLAQTAAKAGDASLAVTALQSVAQYLSPARTLIEMNNAAFDGVRRLDVFEQLSRRLELAAVSLSSGKTNPARPVEKKYRD